MKKCYRVLISILTVSLFLCLLAGSGETKSTDSGSSNKKDTSSEKKDKVKDFYAVNETAKINGVEMTVTNVSKSNGEDFDKPKDGSEYVIVSVKIKNNSKEKVSYNALYFKMQNSKGQITDDAFTTVDQDKQLKSGELAPGGEVAGDVVFEEPVGDKALVLQYQNDIFEDGVKLQFKLN